MNVLLIQPFGNESNNNYPPMGLLYISAYLRKYSQHIPKIIDLRADRSRIEDHLDEIIQFNPGVIGLTGMSIEWSAIKYITTYLKARVNDNVVFIAGGPHSTIFSKMVLQHTPVKYVVRGEGEVSFVELLKCIQEKQSAADVKGISYLSDNDTVRHNDNRDSIADINDIPFPAYDLIDVEKYFLNPHFHGNLNTSKRVLPLISSRGCPFRCKFCHHSFGHKFRARSADNFIAEIDFLVKKYSIREIQIEDDAFNMDIDRAKLIFKRIISGKYDIKIAFANGIRGDRIDDEMVDLFKKAGVYRIHFGIETSVARVRKLVDKEYDMNKVNAAINAINKAGISTHGFFIIGFPTESEEEIRMDIDYAVKSKLATANFSILKIFPGTPFGDEYPDQHVPYSDDFSFSYDSTRTNLSLVSNDRLKKLQRHAAIKFYFYPKRIARIIRTSPSVVGIFTKNFAMVLGLILHGKTKY
ncbi:MAG: radical SAM protein [Kiritimatiellae bacterium]|nr:radical SAM protein [Kiritimatiellia bacterium]